MKIQYPFLWKKLCIALCTAIILVPDARSQCVNNLSTRSYDTLITGPGYGTYNISLPKWSPDSGLLVSVRINVNVSVQYGFTMKNADLTPSVYTLWVGREDAFTSPALTSAYDSVKEQLIGVYPLDPGASVTMSPFSLMNNYNYTDSITTNVVPFQGQGNVSFVYSPVTYTTLHTNNNSSYNYSATATDQVHFSITYLYCRSGGVLATNLIRFTASPVEPSNVQLDWTVVNEVRGRIYEVQRSRDGQSFTTVGTLPSDDGGVVSGTVDYGFLDHLAGAGGSGLTGEQGIWGKWYYRLRIIDPGGILYSPIRQVMLGSDGGGRLIVYPNPAVDYIDLAPEVTGGGGGRSWQVDVIAADGSRVLSNIFRSTNTMRVYFRHALAAGVYFVRTTDLVWHERYFSSFVVQRR